MQTNFSQNKLLDAEQLLAERLLDAEQLLADQLLAEQLLDEKTTSRRKTSHRTTSPSPRGDVLARVHHRKGSLPRSEEKVFYCEDEPRIPSLRTPSPSSLRARTCTSQKGFSTQIVRRKGSVARHRHPAAVGFGLPIRPLLLIPDEVFTGDHTVEVQSLARSGTSDTDGILLAVRNAASPGYFLYPYRRRFRTT